MTYPDPTVIAFIEERFVPVQLDVDEEGDALEPYAVGWTPAIVVLDADDRQHRRVFGYHDPKELMAELALGWFEAAMNQDDYARALERSHDALRLTRGDREREAEARYFAAACDYKTSGDVTRIKKGWGELLDQLPGTAFARRAAFVRDER